ncbi:MAG: SRPBCC domain-containing protein [Nannocystaceae bacterium]|nr:SRPBCC domain-containing protein [Nannocystaceae bacterium]
MSDPKSTVPVSTVLVEVTISAPVDTVWKAVRDPEQIAQWFGWAADSLTDEIAMIFGNPDVVDDAGHKLKFGEWEGIADGFELIEVEGKTLLRVVRFGALPSDWDDVYSDVREGWVTFAHQLRLWVERHHGETRRTVYLVGPTEEPLATKLGLSSEGTVELPTGSVEVRPWHRSGFQLGLRIPAWGDGLLIAMDMPADDERPQRASLVLTTFGMADEDAVAFAQQWNDWWAARGH